MKSRKYSLLFSFLLPLSLLLASPASFATKKKNRNSDFLSRACQFMFGLNWNDVTKVPDSKVENIEPKSSSSTYSSPSGTSFTKASWDYSSQEDSGSKTKVMNILKDPKNPKYRLVADHISRNYVSFLKKESRWVYSALFGNSIAPLTESEIFRLTYAVKFILEHNHYLIFDGHSHAAPTIAELAGDKGLAIITSQMPEAERSKLPRHVIIDNPYLRMIAFTDSDLSVMSNDSITGNALLANGGVDYGYNLASAEKFVTPSRSQLEPASLEPSLGYSIKTFPSHLSAIKRDPKDYKIEFSLESWAKSMDGFDLRKALTSAEQTLQGEKMLRDHLQKTRGALVIGSGKIPSKYTQDIYQIVKALAAQGIPIVTGGSGGVMEIANTAAFDAGAPSVGIPMSGIKTELSTKTSIQTLTIPTTEYEARIPLLLGKRKLILVAPGGTGTQKEIASILTEQAANPDPEQAIVFLGQKYYGPLVKTLVARLPLPLKDQLIVIDKSEDVAPLLEFLHEGIWKNVDRSLIYLPKPPTPRNENKEFIDTTPKYESEYYGRSKGSSFWD